MTQEQEAEDVYRWASLADRDRIDRIAELLGVSRAAAVAMTLASEALRNYCPPAEKPKVAAAMFASAAKLDRMGAA